MDEIMTPEIEKRIKAVRAGRIPAGYKRTAGGIVPNEWEETALEKCLVEYKEKTTKPNQYPMLTSARTALMLQSDYYSGHQVTTDDNVGYNVLPRGYVTFRSRSDDGRFKFNENNIIDKGIISYFYPVFSFNNHVDHKYMLFLLNETIYRQMFPYNEGTAQMVLSFNKLKSLQYSIPPLSEQKKIAEILATQDKVIELKEKLIAEKQSQKKYLMSVLLGDDFKKPFKLNGVTIDKKKWEKSTIGRISDISTGNKDTQNKKDNGKYPFYVRSPNPEKIDTYSYDGEAILTAGDGVGVGKVIHYVTGKFDFHQRVYKISDFDNHKAWGRFVYFYFLEHFYNRVKRMSAKNSVDSVRYNMISEMPLNLPTLPEQKSIAEVLSAADEEISLLQKDLEQEKLKKKSLMQLLLTGLVRVNE